MPTVLLVRHGQASFGAADYDRLSERGVVQAQVVAEALAARGARVDRLVSGAHVRQRDTAQAIAAAFGVPVEVDARWNEYATDEILACHSAAGMRLEGTGGDEGPSNVAFQVVLDEALRGWMAAGEKSPAVESWPAFSGRLRDALHDVCTGLGKGETAVVCTSGGALAAACASVLGASETFVPLQRVAVNAGITRVVHGRSGTNLLSFNEQDHLERDGGSLVTFR